MKGKAFSMLNFLVNLIEIQIKDRLYLYYIVYGI